MNLTAAEKTPPDSGSLHFHPTFPSNHHQSLLEATAVMQREHLPLVQWLMSRRRLYPTRWLDHGIIACSYTGPHLYKWWVARQERTPVIFSYRTLPRHTSLYDRPLGPDSFSTSHYPCDTLPRLGREMAECYVFSVAPVGSGHVPAAPQSLGFSTSCEIINSLARNPQARKVCPRSGSCGRALRNTVHVGKSGRAADRALCEALIHRDSHPGVHGIQ